MWSHILFQRNIFSAKGKHGLVKGTDSVCYFILSENSSEELMLSNAHVNRR